ncbi:RING finger and transmembrane domain-containing protein 1 [Auxenochlorella protothecoides]|uniref:RING finger and transmembrane domain-containing protein 1 n=2 Tax=Auxenochlorella protothecoides TaxID=3075 RepID=A0A087SMI6_AUXPR|nr:RING finger and transmembrane domain-containing protein 1 [Auxenochlorella protothecoides]KFM26940.1 RING finger and transmembrane domain-containing protein 1 [Auxenochlorella protothecoides]
MYLPRPPPAVERGGGTHTLRSLLRRVWQGGEELGSSTRRLEVSFSTGQPQAGHLEAMPSQEGMINQGPGPGPLRDEPLPAGAPSVSALPGALPAPSDDANLADEAEHHRLSTSIGLDLADLGGGVEINAPYLALMLLIFAWRSAAVLALWAGLTALLRRLNRAATAALTDKGAADARALLGRGLAAVLAAAVCAAYLLRPAGRLEAARRGFWATLLLVVAADTCFRILVAAAKEVAEAGSVCPICQEPPTLPVKLPCSHIFCDACVAEWFERERSCPMCRAVTGETRVKSCSDGQTSLMPLLF